MNEAEKILTEAETTTQNEEAKQETTAVAPVVEEKKPNIFARAWGGIKSHKGVILGTIATIGAGVAGFVLGAISSKSDDGYDDYGDGGDNVTPFYGGGSDETESFDSDDESDEDIG